MARAQSRRIRSIIRHAYESVPYYRETMDRLELNPGQFREPADLARLPLLEREQLQQDPEYFLSTANPPGRCMPMASSGSTGAPLMVFWDWPAWLRITVLRQRLRRAVAARIGVGTAYRESLIAMPGGSVFRGESIVRDAVFVPPFLRVRRQRLSLADTPRHNAGLIAAFEPDVVYSYGSYIAELFDVAALEPAAGYRPKAVVFGGDALPETSLRLIKEDLGMAVFSIYQSVEAQPIAFGCGHNDTMHVNSDVYPLRIIGPQGESVRDGEVGEVVVSNLDNRASVILNYRMGDLAALVPETCECGRSLPRMSTVVGRRDDWLRLPGGRLLHPQAACVVFIGRRDVRQYQIIQTAPDRIQVRVVSRNPGGGGGLRRELQARFREAMPELRTIDIRLVDEIERSASGKLSAVTSQVR